MIDHPDIHRLTYQDKEIALVATAHVSRESVELVERVIQDERPETVCVELCQSRFQAMEQKDRWENMDIIKVIREKKVFLLLSNLILASFQKRIAAKFGVKPGMEMIQAIESARAIEAQIHLADRDIRTTLSRTWHSISFWSRIKLMAELIVSIGEVDDLKEEDIERMKKQDILESILQELEVTLPTVRNTLVDERDRYLAARIRTAPGRKILAVVGAGHVPGIKKYLDREIDVTILDELPPPGLAATLLKWVIPTAIVLIIVLGFFISGKSAGTNMIKSYILATGLMAGVGAAAALAHPLSILSAILAAPVTVLHPLIAAGFVSGLVEAFTRKPVVKDFQQLGEDIMTVRGFWRNKVTRILLVVFLTNLGTSIGVFVALPLMVRLLH